MMRRANLSLVIVAVLGLLVMCGSATAVDGNEPVSHWKFDEGEGAIAYDSAGDNDGTLTNGPTWTSGVLDGALEFDGLDDYISVPDSSVFDFGSGDFSMAAWFKTSDSSREQYITDFYGSGNDPHIEIYTAYGNLGTHLLPNDTRITDGYVADGEWHHAAITLDNGANGGYKLYLDGVNVGTNTYSGVLANWETLSIAARDLGYGNEPFDGSIDEVLVYDRALSAEEIQEVYQCGLPEVDYLHIVGPNEVAENFRASYKAVAYYDNNSTRDVTSLAEWSVRPDTSFADIEAGLLTTKEVSTGRERIAVAAAYGEGNIILVPMKPVTIFAVCPTGTALDFNGVDDYVDCGNDNSMKPPLPVTLSAWIKIESIGINHWIVGIDDRSSRYYGIWFYVADYNKLNLGYGDGGPKDKWHRRSKTGTTELSPDTWYHVAAVINGPTDMVLYINGIDDRGAYSGTGGSLAYSSSGSSFIGSNSDVESYFNGVIDEVTIYNRALSAEEILANMHRRLSGDEPNLVGYWDFDEGEGQIAYDLSGNGNNGRLGSTPYADNSDPAWVESDAPVGICPEPVDVDVKPGSCPNPLNVASRGVMPAAILGSAEFDVSLLDAASIELVGVGAIRSSLEDVATPVTDGNECECTMEGPDGYTDLTLKFNTREVVEALGEVASGDVLPVTLTGVLQDGTQIEGTDCVEVVGKFKPFNKGDINKDGVTNIVDFAMMAEDWLESTIVQD